jgi:hypothetical protein
MASPGGVRFAFLRLEATDGARVALLRSPILRRCAITLADSRPEVNPKPARRSLARLQLRAFPAAARCAQKRLRIPKYPITPLHFPV